jgi:hypothetical protein
MCGFAKVQQMCRDVAVVQWCRGAEVQMYGFFKGAELLMFICSYVQSRGAEMQTCKYEEVQSSVVQVCRCAEVGTDKVWQMRYSRGVEMKRCRD